MGYFTMDGSNLKIELPELQTMNGMSLYDAVSFYAPALSQAPGGFLFGGGDFTNISFLRLNATSEIYIKDVQSLEEISFPLVQTLDTLTITNNPSLLIFDGLPNLQVVKWIYMDGSFSNISFPSLKDVTGYVYINSTDPSLLCPVLQFQENVTDHGQTFFCAGTSH